MKQPISCSLTLLALSSLVVGACSDDAAEGVGGSLDAAADASPSGGDAASCVDCHAPALCIEGSCVVPNPGGCTPGEVDGCFGGGAISTCDPSGTAFVPVACPSTEGCRGGECVRVICEPGAVLCEGLASTMACNDDGTAFLEPEPCPPGQYCTSGQCTSTCLSDPKFGDYVGCAYWTVDLPNWPDPTILPTNPEDLPHALVISNPNDLRTEITFEPPPGVTMKTLKAEIPGGESHVFLMPVINTDGTELATKAIRFESTRPILVHQFNPWKAVWSNDASLLLPESFLGQEYVILSWPTDPRGLLDFSDIPNLPDDLPQGAEMPNVNGFFTVVAPYDDTEVTIRVTGWVEGKGEIQAMSPGDTQTLTLDRGQILNIECEPLSLFQTCDLTGSTVDASRPVVVFAGHESAGIAHPTKKGPDGETLGGYLDHLEEQMLPPHVLDSHYLAVKSKPRGDDPDLWRIQAAEDNVTLTTDPPQSGVNGVTLAKRGNWVQVYTEESFEIEATGKIQVGQYLIGSEATNAGTGDPSLMLAVPTQRYRSSYVLTVPPGYDTNWATVIRPAGATITTPEGPIPDEEFEPIGSGEWERAYVALPEGINELSSPDHEKFGLIAYGYNGAMSYGFTGGMD